MQSVQPGNALLVTLPGKNRHASGAGSTVDRLIRHIGQRLALLIDKLEFEPDLFSSNNGLAAIKCVGSVLTIVQAYPSITLVIFDLTKN